MNTNLVQTTEVEENLPALLDKTIKEAGLQLDEGEKIKQSYLPYFEAMAQIKEESTRINWEHPTLTDEKIARDLRLRMVKIRTGSENVKDERKKIHSLKANLEQSTWNLIKSSSLLMEATFEALEKRREIEEKARIKAIKDTRIAELEPYVTNILSHYFPNKELISFEFIDLGNMSESNYLSLLNGAKLQIKAQEEEKIKAEEARIAKEKEEREERERINKENERLKAEAAEKEKQLKIEREKAEVARKLIEEIAAKERALAEAKLKQEREVNEKLQAQVEAEEKARKEAQAKAIADLKAKEAAEKKAKNAPDKQKLIVLADALLNTVLPSVTSEEALNILENVKSLLNKTAIYIKEKANGI